LLKLSFLVVLPLVLLPALLPRKASARRLSSSATSAGATSGTAASARARKVQDLVDEFRTRLAIADLVRVAIVETNPLVVSVERDLEGAGAFSLSIEGSFLEGLTPAELEAVVAHELGHVWIFTHHPYLHTEELANQIAMRVVSYETLSAVYEKVWQRTGRKGDIAYLPPAGSSRLSEP
jgi:hypothetical protein